MSKNPDQSYSVVCLLFCGALNIAFFASGYYIGRADGIDELVATLKSEHFSDAIDVALATDQFSGVVQSESEENQELSLHAALDEDTESSAREYGLLFVARLSGFPKKSGADSYKKKLSTQNIKSDVIQRGAGRRKWYQVVTLPAPYDETAHIVEKLKKEDHLKTVEIVAVQEHGEREERDMYDK
jgi:hypothetical protein